MLIPVRQHRQTQETDILVEISASEERVAQIETGIRFFDHMLEQLAFHGGFALRVHASSLDGILHHLVEDVAITLGVCFKEMLKDKAGIQRYSSLLLPMDEALVQVALDISGRPYWVFTGNIPADRVEDLDVVLVKHFFHSLAMRAGFTLHIDILRGEDPHHIVEGTVKGVARALKAAVQPSGVPGQIPSTKGVL